MAIKHWSKSVMALTVAGFVALGSLPVKACGPFFDEDIFVYTQHPDVPLKKYAGGSLGLLHSTYARSYLVVAYLNLEGKQLSAAQRDDMVKLWKTRLHNSDDKVYKAISDWVDSRKKAGANEGELSIIPYRGFGKKSAPAVYDQSFLNCQTDAFVSAVATLKGLVQRYGAGSSAVKAWLTAQDEVFAHCSEPQYNYKTNAIDPEAPYPQALTDSDATLIKDRQYQIACANFYGTKYQEAKKQFEAIAQDTSSPWQRYGAYLAARAVLRQATVGGVGDRTQLLQEADASFKQIVQDPALSAVHDAAEKLISFVAAQMNPLGRLTELSQSISYGQGGKSLARDIGDFTVLYDSVLGFDDSDSESAPAKPIPEALRFDDLLDWITTMQNNWKDSKAEALRKWGAKHSTVWLIAALTHAEPEDLSPELSKAAEAVLPSSGAYLTVRYHLARLAMGAGHKRDALRFIPDLSSSPPSTVNAFRNLQLALAQNLDDLISAGIQKPAGVTNGISSIDFPEDFDKAEAIPNFYSAEGALTPAVSDFLNKRVPESILVQLASKDGLPKKVKADALQAAWTRAIVLSQSANAATVEGALKKAVPKLSRFLDDFDKSKNNDERLFAAARMFLFNPGLRPQVAGGIGRSESLSELDDFQDNWWCPEYLSLPGEGDQTEITDMKVHINNFLTAEQKAAVTKEITTLKNSGTGADFILRSVMAYARKNPQDPRLPETLYHAVRAPKFSCKSKNSRALSKDAFDFMHAHYPKNSWTTKTKYYYG